VKKNKSICGWKGTRNIHRRQPWCFI